jgi:hypothetical protein
MSDKTWGRPQRPLGVDKLRAPTAYGGAPSRGVECTRRALLEKDIALTFPIRADTLSGATVPGLVIVHQSGAVYGSSAREDAILFKFAVEPLPVPVDGMDQFIFGCKLARYWNLDTLSVEFAPNNKDLDGEVWGAIASPEEAEVVQDYRSLRAFPDAHHGPLGVGFKLTVTDTSTQTWAVATATPDGLHWSPFSLSADRRKAMSGTSQLCAGCVFVGFTNYGELLKQRASYALGDIVVRGRLCCYENPIPVDDGLDFRLLFPGAAPTGSGVTSGVRKGAELLSRDTVVPNAQNAVALFNASPPRRLRQPNSMFMEPKTFTTPVPLGAWPAILSTLGQLGKDLVGKFLGDKCATPGIGQYMKLLILDRRDPQGLTPLPGKGYVFSQTSIIDSNGSVISDAAVCATADPGWEALEVDTSRKMLQGLALSGRRKTPSVGVTTYAYVQCATFDDGNPNTVCYGQGISADSGAYAGPAIEVVVANRAPGAPALLGTLIKYQQLGLSSAAPPSAASDFFSNIISLASSALGGVTKAATVVANILGADGQPTGGEIQTYSPAIVPEGERNSAQVSVPYALPADFYKLHFANYNPAFPNIYSHIVYTYPAPTATDACVSFTFSAIINFNGLLAEKHNHAWVTGAVPGSKRRTAVPAQPAGEASMEVAATGEYVNVVLAGSITPVCAPLSTLFNQDPRWYAPVVTPGSQGFSIEQAVPWHQLVNTKMSLGDGSKVDNFAPVSLEGPISFNAVVAYPEKFIDEAGNLVPYKAGDSFCWGVHINAEVSFCPDYDFHQVSGDSKGELQWHPADIVMAYNHPNDLTITGTTGVAILENYGQTTQTPYPVVAFARRVILNGTIATDAAPPGGGIEFSQTSFGIRNILETGNSPSAA